MNKRSRFKQRIVLHDGRARPSIVRRRAALVVHARRAVVTIIIAKLILQIKNERESVGTCVVFFIFNTSCIMYILRNRLSATTMWVYPPAVSQRDQRSGYVEISADYSSSPCFVPVHHNASLYRKPYILTQGKLLAFTYYAYEIVQKIPFQIMQMKFPINRSHGSLQDDIGNIERFIDGNRINKKLIVEQVLCFIYELQYYNRRTPVLSRWSHR